jgi:biotin carboxyl carrier protein
LISLCVLAIAGCTGGEPDKPPAGHGDEPAAVSNRIDIPDAVRANLGITFATVEQRQVEAVLRYAGRFELTPDAFEEHASPMAGRVSLVAKELSQVAHDDVLATIASPALGEIRAELLSARHAADAASEAQASVVLATAAHTTGIAIARQRSAAIAPLMSAVRDHIAATRVEVETLTAREAELVKLAASGGGVATALADVRASVAAGRARLTEVLEEEASLNRERELLDLDVATLEANTASVEAAEATAIAAAARADAAFQTRLAAEALRLGVTPEWLAAPVSGAARWMTLSRIEIRATRAGLLSKLHVASGSWVDEGGAIATIVDRTALRFRADVLQSDLHRIADGAVARIEPPDAGTRGRGSISGTVTMLPGGDADTRTSVVLVTCAMPSPMPTWVRDGVVALVEVRIDGGDEVLAIPERCVVRDGIERVFFRRDPNDADKVIRVVADLGASDGFWVAVLSGVGVGNEVVLDGAYPLSLTGGGKASAAGHFHADGTFHAGNDH